MNKEALDYKADTEQPNCEGCEFFKHTDKFDHCWRYTEARSLCKLRQEPVEQPPASDFTEKVRKDWDKNIFGGVIFDLCTRLDRSEAGERILEDRIEKLSDTLDRSEASRKDLLAACDRGLAKAKGLAKIAKEMGIPEDTPGNQENRQDIELLEAAIIKEKGD